MSYVIDIDYILLNVLLVIVFYYAGCKLRNTPHVLPYMWSCIISFTFVLGSRYLRGNDYLRYQHTFLYDDDASQVIFTQFNTFLRWIGINEDTFLYIYSFIFIIGALIFLKTFKPYLKYLLPAFLIAFIFFNEYCIRQALGFSFIFLYMKELFRFDEKTDHIAKRILILALYAFLAYSMHSVNALNLVFITAVYLCSFRLISWKLTIPAFIICALILSQSINWKIFETFLGAIGGFNEKFSNYTNQADTFFSSNAFQSDYSRSTIGNILEIIGHSSLLYLGYRAIQSFCNEKRYIALYNIYALGAIINRCFWNYELLRRVFDPMLAFWCFPFAIVLAYGKKLRKIDKVILLGLFYFIYEMGFKYLVERGDMTLFLWDK